VREEHLFGGAEIALETELLIHQRVVLLFAYVICSSGTKCVLAANATGTVYLRLLIITTPPKLSPTIHHSSLSSKKKGAWADGEMPTSSAFLSFSTSDVIVASLLASSSCRLSMPFWPEPLRSMMWVSPIFLSSVRLGEANARVAR